MNPTGPSRHGTAVFQAEPQAELQAHGLQKEKPNIDIRDPKSLGSCLKDGEPGMFKNVLVAEQGYHSVWKEGDSGKVMCSSGISFCTCLLLHNKDLDEWYMFHIQPSGTNSTKDFKADEMDGMYLCDKAIVINKNEGNSQLEKAMKDLIHVGGFILPSTMTEIECFDEKPSMKDDPSRRHIMFVPSDGTLYLFDEKCSHLSTTQLY